MGLARQICGGGPSFLRPDVFQFDSRETGLLNYTQCMLKAWLERTAIGGQPLIMGLAGQRFQTSHSLHSHVPPKGQKNKSRCVGVFSAAESVRIL